MFSIWLRRVCSSLMAVTHCAAIGGSCQVRLPTNELMAVSRDCPAGSPFSQFAAPAGSFCAHWRATVSSALLRNEPSGNAPAHAAADCGSEFDQDEMTASAALFWPSPGGRPMTKFAASRGACCAQLEVIERYTCSRSLLSESLPAQVSADWGSLFAHCEARLF